MHTPPKILIVDDTPLNVALLEQLLDELGYETVSASNGQEALDLVPTAEPDLILLDIMMPVMDGFETLERLKANSSTRELPVIIISAQHDLADVVRGIERGAEDYLPKPFEPVLLRARLGASLEKKRLRDIETKYRRALERELEIGREIQASFLPARLPQPPGWELAARFFAQRQVAGDLYDAFRLPRANVLCLVVGDVSGKGVGAALYMTLFRTLIRVLVLESDAGETTSNAAHLLQAVRFTNQYVARTHGDASMFASLFAALVDPETGSSTYVNAGHNPPLLISRQGVQTLTTTGMVLGLSPDEPYEAGQVQIAPGETLLVYTDGVTEAIDLQAYFYGEARLERVAADSAHSANALLTRLTADLFDFMVGTEQADDITLLALHRRAGQDA
jgi:serine phosphatase RsbU (regulator of sigma subunit)